ncbi:MAG: 30S ribosomal protein S4 [Candidatus Nanohaloarchaea archaeon]|nr:30S ribosomal protein S4 [Candidatus Nanohaloarchaea archaeon]
MKRQSKAYETPVEGWSEDRIATETDLKQDYGLANKREVWKAQSTVRDFRRQARKLNAEENEDIHVEDVLDRRLQTAVYRRGLADTMKEARQLVTHGHIQIGDRSVTIPGYLVTEDEETQITVAAGSEHVVDG